MFRHVVMKYFSNASREISLFAKHLGQGLDVGKAVSNVELISLDPRLVGIESRHQGSATRTAKWILTEGIGKSHALLRQTVDVWRFYNWVTITAKVTIEVITDEKQNIWFIRNWLVTLGQGTITKTTKKCKRKSNFVHIDTNQNYEIEPHNGRKDS